MYVYEGRVAVSCSGDPDTEQQKTMLSVAVDDSCWVSSTSHLQLADYDNSTQRAHLARGHGALPAPRGEPIIVVVEKRLSCVSHPVTYVRTGHPMSLLTAHQPGARGNT